DDAELVLETLEDLGRRRIAVALPGALHRDLAEQRGLVRDAFGERELRYVILLLELEVDRIRYGERVLQHVRPVGERRGHLLRALEVEARVVAHPVRVIEVLAEADAEEHV